MTSIPSIVTSAPLQTTVAEGSIAGIAFLLGRVLFGAVLAFMGANHFVDADALAGYADAKGVPAPKPLVLVSGGILVLGGLGISLGAYPVLAAGALAVFFLVTTPVVHDFWAAGDDEQQTEMNQFLKNAALLGGAFSFLAIGGTNWPYAVDVGLF